MHKFFKGLALISIAALSILGCSDRVEVPITQFMGYGAGHPGALNPIGGEITIEKIHRGGITMTQSELNAFFRFWDDPANNTELPPLPPGACADITLAMFPDPPPPNTRFQDMGATLTLTAGTTTVSMPRVMNDVDNIGRANATMYGGTGPTGMFENYGDVDDTKILYDTTYEVSFTGPDGASTDLDPPRMHFPGDFDVIDPPVGEDTMLVFERDQAVTFRWEPLGQNVGDGRHTAERTFSFLFFQGTDMAGTAYLCPMNDGMVHGEFTVPATVINALGVTGFMQLGQTTHYMAALDGHRIDMYGIACRISDYRVQ